MNKFSIFNIEKWSTGRKGGIKENHFPQTPLICRPNSDIYLSTTYLGIVR